MSKRIAFAAKNKIGLLTEDKLDYIQSQYMEDYKEQRAQIRRKRAWKAEGSFSAFRGDWDPERLVDLDDLIAHATINGLSCQMTDKKLIYSISVGDASGIFLIDPEALTEDEGHIIHDTSIRFYGLDYCPARHEIAVAVEDSPFERNIALLTMEKCRLKQITEGDSYDNNPVWSKLEDGVIYYDSAGIGRTKQGSLCIGPRSIMRLDLKSANLEEFITIPRCDCYLPKLDAKGNLYYIKRPYQRPRTGATLTEILLIPFKIIKAIYKWIEFFTLRHTGEPLTTAGANPAKTKQDLRRMLIDGNIVNAERSLNENRRYGETFPGIAPRNWELIRCERDGTQVTVKKGVLTYDLTEDGEIIYSNGTYLIQRAADGTEHELGKMECSGVVKAL